MKDTTMTSKKDHGAGVNPAVIAVGAALGAGAAVAVRYAMKDERTKKKVNDVLSSVKDQTLDYVESFTSHKTNGRSHNGNGKSLTEGVKKEGMKAIGTSDK